jgi:predicted DCC family thiol-disulfide oxidoreductase YuxK
MRRLTVLYDAGCPICVRCAHFLSTEPAYVEIELLPAGSREARARYGEVPWLGEELVVVSDEGAVWAGPAAFLVTLWALEGYREWSYRLSGEALAPMAERFFHALSSKRKWLAGWLSRPECAGGACRASAHAVTPYR